MNQLNQFPAKVLLFGEYGLLLGASGLVMPLNQYSANWQPFVSCPAALQSGQTLKQLHHYLSCSPDLEQIKSYFNWKRFTQDVDHPSQDPLYFQSNIPQGHGMGSSGALCAALYQRYGINLEVRDLPQVHQQRLAKLEDFFHHQSSGLDPLVSWTGSAFHLTGLQGLKPLPDFSQLWTQWQQRGMHCYLINTHLPRQTSTWVAHFKRLLEGSEEFSAQAQSYLGDLVDRIVTHFLALDVDQFWPQYEQLCQWQQKKMIDFFPTPLKGWMDHWHREHPQRPLGLKLCGAGGGGFFLLMTRDPATAHMARQQALSFGFELINLSHE